MIKSLEKLKSGCWFPPGSEAKDPDYFTTKKLADEIQAEVDENYVLRSGCLSAIVADTAWNGVSTDELRRVCDILMEHGTLDAYIDKFYFPRPLFEDGEPVQVGDYIDLQTCGKRQVQVTAIEPWIVYGSSTCHQKEPYKRPPEPDTQEKIDADIDVGATEYCNKYNVDHSKGRPGIEKCRHLLARQRKLDGVE